MLDTALCGYEYSGLPKVLNVVEYARAHPPSALMRVRRESTNAIFFDGGGRNGMYRVLHATTLPSSKRGRRASMVMTLFRTEQTYPPQLSVAAVTRL